MEIYINLILKFGNVFLYIIEIKFLTIETMPQNPICRMYF